MVGLIFDNYFGLFNIKVLFKLKHVQPFHLTSCKITGSNINNKKIDNDSLKKKC
jgi:hypothetical protein